MSELQSLISQREQLLAEIRTIEETCEGIENENNARRMQELNLEKSQLAAQQNKIQNEINTIHKKLSSVNAEMARISETGIDRILEAVKNQRWYYFKNKTHIMFDKTTGLLWSNPAMVPFIKPDKSSYTPDEAVIMAREFEGDGFGNWKIVTRVEFEKISYPGTDYPYYTGNNRRIYNTSGIIMDWNNYENYTNVACWWTDHDWGKTTTTGVFLIFTRDLVADSEYEKNVSAGNPNYTEKEQLQFTLDLFVQHDLWPIFCDEEITELYGKLYCEKPKLLNRLQKLQVEIQQLQTVIPLSSTFDYTVLLAKYDLKAIDRSLIQYYQAVQSWVGELMEKLDFYEQEKEEVIRKFDLVGRNLSETYENRQEFTHEENTLFRNRKRFLSKCFSPSTNGTREMLLTVKRQADELEYRIDQIDSGHDPIHQLALLEKEELAGFALIAENTAKIVRNALKKIEFFEANRQYVVWAVNALEQWTKSYIAFRTEAYEDLKISCEKDGISREKWQKWYNIWQLLRFQIEEKLQPALEREFRQCIPMIEEDEIPVAQQLISELELYKNDIDTFFREERKRIHQNFASQIIGDIQDELETEMRIYQLTAQFQSALKNILFNCSRSEDRIFILKWAADLSDIPIRRIFSLAAEHGLLPDTETEFPLLLGKNYHMYLTDIKSYGELLKKREQEFRTLVCKMR